MIPSTAESARKKILYLSPVLNFPAKGGNFIRVKNSIKTLSKLGELGIVPTEDLLSQEAEAFFNNFGTFYKLKTLEYIPRKFRERVYYWASRRINKICYPQINICLRERKKFEEIEKIITNLQPDLLWLGFANISYPLFLFLTSKFNIPIVFDTDSVWSLYLERCGNFLENPKQKRSFIRSAKKFRKYETNIIPKAQWITAVSELEKLYYQDLGIAKEKVFLFSNAVDFEDYPNLKPNTKADPDANRLFIGGSFWPNSPMSVSCHWFLESVWPDLKRANPDFKLVIAGRNAEKEIKIRDSDITVISDPNDINPILRSCQIAVVPTLCEAGTRLKILEAGAVGLPVVSTRLGAEGLSIESENHFLLADSSKEMVAQILRLQKSKELRDNISRNLHLWVKENGSVDTQKKEAMSILKAIEGALS
jgi:glycosyltransferase involved in cell wall biosynthesis